MQPFDPNKSRRAKLTTTISDFYGKSPFNEQICCIDKLLDGFSATQIEVLFDICKNIFRSSPRTTKSSNCEKAVPLEAAFKGINVTDDNNDLAGPDIDAEMVKQLLYDILEGLSLNDEGKLDDKTPVLHLASSPSLASLARKYFLNKYKDLGRLRMYPSSTLRPSSVPGSAKSVRSNNSLNLNPQLREALNIVLSEWKVTERMELCTLLIKQSEVNLVNAIHEQFLLKLKKSINIGYLPDHLLLYMMTYLEPVDISHCAGTCRRWHDLARSQRLWQYKCIEMGRKILLCPDLSMVVSFAVRKRVAKNRTDVAKCPAESRIDWKAVCKLVVSVAIARRKMRETSSLLQEKSQFKLFGFKRKITIEEDADTADAGQDASVPVNNELPPVQMFPQRKAKDKLKKGVTEWDKDELDSDDAESVREINREMGNARVGSASKKTNVYVQARSITRPNAPVYPDIEKPLKTVVQDVLDTRVLQGHMGIILCLYFDGVRLYSGGADNVVRLWHPRGSRCLLKFLGHKGGVHSLDYCTETSTLFSGSWDTTIRIWDVGQSRAAGIMSGHRGTVTGVLVISTTLLLSSSNDGTIRLWNTLGCDCIAQCSLLSGPQSELYPLLKLCVLQPEPRDFVSVQASQKPVISATLCADGSVFVTSLAVKSHLKTGQNDSDATSDKNETVVLRWVPWTSLKNDKQIVQQGSALTLHGELLVVATYGQRRAQPVILGRHIEEIRTSHDSASSINKDALVEGGVIWLAKLSDTNALADIDNNRSNMTPSKSKPTPGHGDKSKLLTPSLYAAISVRTMPTALFCTFGKLYIGMIDGSIQMWDLGDLILMMEFRPHTSRVRDIKASLDVVTTCDDDGKIVVTRLSPAMPTANKGPVILRR